MTYRQLGQKEEFIFITNAHQRKTKTLDFLLIFFLQPLTIYTLGSQGSSRNGDASFQKTEHTCLSLTSNITCRADYVYGTNYVGDVPW